MSDPKWLDLVRAEQLSLCDPTQPPVLVVELDSRYDEPPHCEATSSSWAALRALEELLRRDA